MTLLEAYNLLVLVVCWAGILGLFYMGAAVDWYTPIGTQEDRRAASGVVEQENQQGDAYRDTGATPLAPMV